ncbi:uncharacterized protein [Onthophagus taurus]|uniref:uncharacterized protein n=1 Tax=Onthophagus taurus TaxID=166361 RepID=UPI0039BE6E2C
MGTRNNAFKNFIIEIRPKLQSINVIVNLELDVKCLGNNWDVIYDGKSFVVGTKLFEIPYSDKFLVPDKISCINVNENFLSFKCFTKNDFGTFSSQVLLPDIHQNNRTNLDIEIKKNVDYQMQCIKCSTFLSENICFKKILPLPSENIDSSNWFCHGHKNIKSLDPDLTDFFYIYSYIHLNSNLFKNISKSSIISCKTCSNWLGVVLNSDSFRIWSNTISFLHDTKLFSTDPLNDAYFVIKSLLNDSILGTCKIILHCFISDDESNYILLWILERNINVIFGTPNDYSDNFVSKILYKYVNDCDDLVTQWGNDPIIPTVQISINMIAELNKYLDKMNLLLPKIFSTSNGFKVSYLPLK